MKILILASTTKRGTSTTKLEEEAKQRGHTVTVLSYLDMHLWFNNKGGHHRVFHNGKRIHRGDFDVIIPRIGKDLRKGVEILTMLVYYLGMKSIITPEALSLVTNKWHTFSRLAQYGIMMPKTIKIDKAPYDLSEMVKWLGGYPIILKGETGSQGKGVVILETETTAKMVVEDKVNNGISFTLQQFVNTSKTNRKRDIRVWVIDGKVIGAYTRFSGEDGDPRTNYSINKLGKPTELTEQERNIALKTAQAVGLQVAAIDLARCIDTAKTYVFEVNGNGSLKGFSKVTEIPLAKHIIDYTEKVAQGIVNQPLELPTFAESMEAHFEGLGEGNTETVACRITPTAKEYLHTFAEQHGYENISACMKSLLYNGSRYFAQNQLLQKQREDLTSTIEKQAVTIQEQKAEIQRLKRSLNSYKTAHSKQKREIQRLTKRQEQSFYMGDHHTQFEELIAELQWEYGETLPLVLAAYVLEVQSEYVWKPNINKIVKRLKLVEA